MFPGGTEIGQHLGLPARSGLLLLAGSAECVLQGQCLRSYCTGYAGCRQGGVGGVVVGKGVLNHGYGATYPALALCEALDCLAGCDMQVLNFAANGTTAASGLNCGGVL